MCGDPDREIITILLTNRVYPTAENDIVGTFRRKFNTAVRDAVDAASHGQ